MKEEMMEDAQTEELHALVQEINDQGVFDIALEWAFDHNGETKEHSEVYALITAGWAGKQHKLEFGTEDNDLIEPLLQLLNGVSRLSGMN